jgi:hypothetical protein
MIETAMNMQLIYDQLIVLGSFNDCTLCLSSGDGVDKA